MAERGRPRAFDKEAALTRAMEVFWRKGYEGASMTDLTGAMGIASPSLYAAFGSKEELFREALQHYSATEGEEIWGGVPAAPTAFAAVESYLMSTARVFTRRNKPPGCLIVLSALHPAAYSDRVRQTLIAMRAEAVTGLRERFQQGIVDGEIAPTADIAAIAQYYVTVQQGMSIQARDGASRRELEAIAGAALAAWPALIGAAAPAVSA